MNTRKKNDFNFCIIKCINKVSEREQQSIAVESLLNHQIALLMVRKCFHDRSAAAKSNDQELLHQPIELKLKLSPNCFRWLLHTPTSSPKSDRWALFFLLSWFHSIDDAVAVVARCRLLHTQQLTLLSLNTSLLSMLATREVCWRLFLLLGALSGTFLTWEPHNGTMIC